MVLFKIREVSGAANPIVIERVEVEEKPTCYVRGCQRISKKSINKLQVSYGERHYMYCLSNDPAIFVAAKMQYINDEINRTNKEIRRSSDKIKEYKSKLSGWQMINENLKALEQDRKNAELVNTLITNFSAEAEQKLYLKSYIPMLTTIMEVLTNQPLADAIMAVEA